MSYVFFLSHIHVTMAHSSYISIARKLNQCNLFTYPPVCESMLELNYILKRVIIIFTFYDNRIVCHKTLHSINDKISE